MEAQAANPSPLLDKDAEASSGAADGPDKGGRDRFSSHTAFYFAAIGRAVGFGRCSPLCSAHVTFHDEAWHSFSQALLASFSFRP